MNRYYKILCMWVAVAMAFMGLLPVASLAQGVEIVEQTDERQPVPPRPDLMAQLQMAAPMRPGFSLSGVTDAKKANAAYQAYLSKKLGAMTADQGRVAVQPQVRPTIDHVLVALVEFSGTVPLLHNQIPKPNPQNNTDWWVEDFSEAYYNRMLFDVSWDYSLSSYFREASCDSPTPYILSGDIHPWTQVPGTAQQYGNDAATGVDNDDSDGYDIYQLVKDAADTVASWPEPARPLDGWYAYAGDDNIVAYFIVVHAGKGQEAGGGALGDDAIWSVRGTLPNPYQIGTTGYYVKDFIVVSEDAPVGVLAHEMGHMFGLPDTWNPPSFDPTDEVNWPYQDAGPGARDASPAFYDVMGQGCWLGRPLGTKPATMTAWERRQIGWLTRTNLAEWNLAQLPASAYLYELSKPSAANKAITITLPNYAYTGTHVFWTYDPSYTNQPSYLTHTLQIPESGSVQFRWRQRYELYANTARVNVHHAGGTTTLATFTGTSPNWEKTGQVGWEQASVDLTPYLDQMIDITFYLARTSVPEGEGWFLDDFELVQDGIVIWKDETELSQDGPPQWEGDEGWQSVNFPWIVAEHFYMAEWRNDGPTFSAAGFDMGLQEAYNMTDISTGNAKYFRYNPGLLLWYVNPRYQLGDNNIVRHPGAGFLLAVDSHPDPIMRASNPSLPWRSRVQMLDATFRHSASTYGAEVYELIGGTLYTTFIPSLPAVATFWDKMSSYPYWKPGAPDNSARTYQYGVRLYVEGENPDVSGATINFSIDAGDMRTSKKSVSRSEAQPGDVLEYTIVLTNTGIADAHTIVVDDPTPANTTYIVGSGVVSGSPTYTLTETSAGLYWWGTVRLGQPVTITFRVQLVSVIDNGTIITNVAHVREGNVPEVDLFAYTRVRSEPCLTSSWKESEPQAVYGGDLVTYTIYLMNTGNSNSTVWVTDCIGTQPCPVTYDPGSLAFSSGQGYYDPQTNCIYWTGVVTANIQEPTVVITFRGRVPEGQEICTRITNRAWISDGFHPPFDITTFTDVLRGSNFVNSTKTVSSAETAPGAVLTYTIQVHNSGNLDGGARLTDTIPANTTYVPGSLVVSGGSGAYDSINNRITWTGMVAKLATVTIRFNVTVTSPLVNGTIITNTALLVDDTRPNEPIYLITTTTVVSGPRLTHSTKSVTVVDPGTLLTYTIGLLNDGNENTTVTVTDTIPAGTSYIPDSFAVQPPETGSGGYDSEYNRIVWSGPIAVGARITLTFGVNITLTGTGIITNSAVVNDGVNQPFTLTAMSRVAAVGVVVPEGPFYCGDLIAVPIRVCNVADLQGFEIEIGFDPAILNVESIQEGTWFYPAAWPTKIFSNTEGTATVVAMLLSRPSGLSDDGNCAVLFTLNFRAVGDGTSPITITHSLLSNTPSPSFTPIAHNRINGSVAVNPRRIEGRAFLQGRPENDHDGAILTSSASGSRILATTAPDGSYSFCPPVGNGQSFTLYIKKNGYLYAQRTIVVSAIPLLTLPDVTLLGGDPIAPQVTVVKPSYCITVTTPLTITVAGNLDGSGDGKVNVLDLSFVGARFGKTPAAVDWVNTPDGCFPEYMSYRADINEDNVVNIFDLVLVGTNFYKQAPVPWP